LICNSIQSTISVKSEPLSFPGKPKNSKDIEVIDLSKDEEEQPRVEQAMTLTDLDPQEQQAMTFKRFSCPMCNNSSHVFKEKNGVETHILNKHKITNDMLKVI
jgi:hypothetical protein